jgi:hypothetical protein
MAFMKSHLPLWEGIATYFVANQKTLDTLHKRAGSSVFFTRDLPALGKAFDASLTGIKFDLTDVPFKKRSQTDERPAFMHEFFSRTHCKMGYVKPDVCGKDIQKIRQLLFVFYKYEMPMTPEMVSAATEKFLSVDDDVKQGGWPSTLDRVRSIFRSVLPDNPIDIRPHHSNGATFDKSNSIQRRTDRNIYPALFALFGLDTFYLDANHAIESMTASQSEIRPLVKTRVSFVPKDSRGPRTICIEAHEVMMVQKGLQQLIYDHVELYSPAKGFINFTDQSVNRRLAQLGSLDGSYATIDLKDASDLVSWDLVSMLSTDEWREALEATRSTVACLPNGTERKLKKYAPMGSALCFPIEAIVFWAIARTVTDLVYVYGDDIIVRREAAGAVIDALEGYGLAVNRGKTLTTGLFRESCGGDYYAGCPIHYIKCKSYDKSSFIPFLNHLGAEFGQKLSDDLCHWYENWTSDVVYRRPISERINPEAYVFYTEHNASNHVFFRRRFNKDLQCFETRRLFEVSRPVGMKTDDDRAMYFDWLCEHMPANQPEDYHINREYIDFNVYYYRWDDYLENRSAIHRQERKPVTKFVWGVDNPVT